MADTDVNKVLAVYYFARAHISTIYKHLSILRYKFVRPDSPNYLETFKRKKSDGNGKKT